MNFKNIVFSVSFIGTVYVITLINTSIPGICYEDSSALICSFTSETAFNVSIFFPFILFFSLVTFKMKEQAFVAWWKFARIAIPIIFLASLYINLYKNPNSGGWFSVENEIDLVALSTMYLVFVIGSAIQVFRGYRQDKTLS